MIFDIITIFPKAFESYLNLSILERAQAQKIIQIKIHNLRDFSKDKHKKVDDKPYGGGAGMVLKIEPLIKAVSNIKYPAYVKTSAGRQVSRGKTEIVLFTPAGKQFNNKIAAQLAKNCEHLILICGRYEGIDERVKKVFRASGFKFHELSTGPYVLTGGELPAMILIDAVSRQIPGVLGKQESLEEKRFGIGVPAYTRPEVFIWKGKKYPVPKVLLSGNHKKIEEWRKKQIK